MVDLRQKYFINCIKFCADTTELNVYLLFMQNLSGMMWKLISIVKTILAIVSRPLLVDGRKVCFLYNVHLSVVVLLLIVFLKNLFPCNFLPLCNSICNLSYITLTVSPCHSNSEASLLSYYFRLSILLLSVCLSHYGFRFMLW